MLQFEKDYGRKPNAKELDGLIGGVVKVVEDGWFSDTYGFDLSPAERSDMRNAEKMQRFSTLLEQYRQHTMGGSDVPATFDEQKIKELYHIWDQQGYLDADN